MLKKITLFALIITAFLVAGCSNGESDSNDIPKETETAETPPPSDSAPAENDNTATPEPVIETPQPGNNIQEGFFFTAGDVEIHMSAPALPIIEKIGEPLQYFEAPSCAFDGVDKSWFYNSFEIHAYPVDGEDFILSVILNDDIYGTDKFIYIGMTYDDMIAAYGNDYEQEEDQYLYRLGGTSLAFILLDDDIIQITYRYEDAPEL